MPTFNKYSKFSPEFYFWQVRKASGKDFRQCDCTLQQERQIVGIQSWFWTLEAETDHNHTISIISHDVYEKMQLSWNYILLCVQIFMLS